MNIKNARFVDEHKTAVDCDIEHPVFGWIPTTILMDGDDRPELVEALAAVDVEVYRPEENSEEEAAAEVRAVRDSLIVETDWYLIREAETGESTPEAVRAYRQALRDITEQEGFPLSVVWPEL